MSSELVMTEECAALSAILHNLMPTKEAADPGVRTVMPHTVVVAQRTPRGQRAHATLEVAHNALLMANADPNRANNEGVTALIGSRLARTAMQRSVALPEH